jgi:hypothetical protein
VFGRGELQRYIAEAIEGEARFVVVWPQAAPGATTRKIGKSFAERILRSMLPGNGSTRSSRCPRATC